VLDEGAQALGDRAGRVGRGAAVGTRDDNHILGLVVVVVVVVMVRLV
jgi:hypothetical protein